MTLRALALGVALGVALVLPVAGAAQSSGVRVGAIVDPPEVRVGEPVTLVVRVSVPVGTELFFPSAVDSTGPVEPLDPVIVTRAVTGDVLEATATYRFLAWRPGRQVVPLRPIRLVRGERTQELDIGEYAVDVVTVLPTDTAARVPQPARSIVLEPQSRAGLIAMTLGALALIALAVWWVRRRRHRRHQRVLGPYERAQRAFGALGELDLLGAGEHGRAVAAAADIVRQYLGERDPRASQGLTSREVVGVMRDDGAVPASRVATLLDAVDAVKFAGGAVDRSTAAALVEEAASVVAATHSADAHRAGRPARRKR